MKKSVSTSHFSTPTCQSDLNTFTGFMQAGWTVVFVPEHSSHIIHPQVARRLRDTPLPLNLPIETELTSIQEVLKKSANSHVQPRLTIKELTGLMGILMQFTLYLPKLRPFCETPAEHVEALYQACVSEGMKTPLSFAEQLATALKQTEGDLPEALWRLFITARQYARWYDTEVLVGMPQLSQAEAMERMATWSRSLRATKNVAVYPDQDAAGDTYYCWTHALAKVAFNQLAQKQTPLVRAQAFALLHGTELNHKIAHKISPQSLSSDHTIAAAYGNAIGDLCVTALRAK